MLPQADGGLHVDEAGVFAELPVHVVGDPPLPVVGIHHFSAQKGQNDAGFLAFFFYIREYFSDDFLIISFCYIYIKEALIYIQEHKSGIIRKKTS